MIRSWLSITFVIVVVSGFSQSVESGASWKQTPGHRPIKFAGIAQHYIWLVNGIASDPGHVIEDLSLEYFDTSSLSRKGVFVFSGLFEDRQQFYPEDVMVLNDTVRIFGSVYDKSKHRNKLQVKNLGKDGKIISQRELFAYETAGFTYNRRRFELIRDKRSSLLAVAGIEAAGNKLASDFHMVILDSSLKEIKKFSTTLPYLGAEPEITNSRLDEYGNLHIVVRRKRTSDSLDYGYSLFAFPVLSQDVVEFQLDIPGKQITSLAFDLTADDKLLVAGLYRESFQRSPETSGLFYLKIDRETASVESKEIKQLDKAFFNLFAGNEGKQERKNFNNLLVKQLISNTDGGSLMIAEQEWSGEVCESDIRTGLTECNMHFYNHAVLVVKFNSRGETDWFQVIPKTQHTIEDGGNYSSYIFREAGKKMMFYYNASNELARSGFQEEMQVPERSVLFFSQLDGSGQISNGKLSGTEGFPILPSVVFSGQDLYFIGEKKPELRLFRFKRGPF